MCLSGIILFSLLGVSLTDKPSSGYGAPAIPQVKYGGPIVYSAEKPPIIHFPPPPAEVSIIFYFKSYILAYFTIML